jgi:CheY-like chemotaxis protein
MSEMKLPDVILIAEDSPPNRRILEHLLNKLGFMVIACEDGQEAWAKLTSAPPGRIVAVISDIMMPNLDGLQLLRLVREHKTMKTLPFVLVTAVSERGYITQAIELSVNGYILKPVTFQRVTEQLQTLFPARKFPKLVG